MNNSEHLEVTKLWNKSYIFILIINTLISFSFYMVATILSKYLLGIGTSISLAGVIVGLFSITSLFCRPLCGLMSDRLNRVKLLKISNLLMAVGLIGFAITESIPLIIVFRIINGIGFAIGATVQMAIAIDYIPSDKMGEGIGYIGLGMVMGSAVAPGFGIAIADTLGIKMTFIIAGLLAFAAFALVFTFKESAKEKAASVKGKISINDFIALKALPLTIVGSTISFISGIVASYLVLFADIRNITGISVYFTVCAVVLFIVRPFSGKLTDKKGLKITVIPALLVTAVSMFLLGRSATLIMIIITGILRSIGQGAAQPSLQAGCIKKVGQGRNGVATSTYYLGGDIGQGIGPMIGGFILNQNNGIGGYRILFDVCGIIILLATVFFVFATRSEHKNIIEPNCN